MGESEHFKVEVGEGVARCSMSGPRMNAMGDRMMYPMVEGLREVLENDEVRVILIRGEGGNFCTGADLSIMGEKMDPAKLFEDMQTVTSVFHELHEGPKPVITEVDGWAVGGGFSLAIASDITYATERALFLMSFIRISIIPDLGSSYFLTRRVGLARAKELALTAKVINAEEAYRIGLVNEVVEHGESSEKAMKVAKRMARGSPRALATAKRNLNVAHSVDLRTMMNLEDSTQPFMVMSQEHKRDVEDFLKKQSGGS
jgi:2-(1,2-epoxy-1,2-dihydrophenyl)acetyl-CoA isomerase